MAKAVKKAEGEEPEKLRIEYWPLTACLEQRWKDNAKRHDIPLLAQSIQRYGFKDPIGFDRTLGAFAEGNGRAEALGYMKTNGMAAPRGVIVSDGGEWLIPVALGVDAASLKEAQAYAVDHNNLVLAGGSFKAEDAFRLWGEKLYGIFESKEDLPLTFAPDAIAELVLAQHKDPLATTDPEPAKPTGNGGGPEPTGPEPSHVRMVQLFLDTETLPEFQTNTEKLMKIYDTSSVTDTVIECIRRAAAE